MKIAFSLAIPSEQKCDEIASPMVKSYFDVGNCLAM